MPEPTVVLTDIALGESARRHDGRIWFSDRIAGEVPGRRTPTCPAWACPPRGTTSRWTGGEVAQTVPLDRGGFDCALSPDATLYVVAADFSDPEALMRGSWTGRLFRVTVPVGS